MGVSGICGLLPLDGRDLDAARLQTALDVMATVPAAGRFTWTAGDAGGAGLGVAAFAGPAVTAFASAGSLAVVADARIDNRAELLPQLDVDAASDDAVLILAAYRKWGETCAARLVGEFAAILWDAGERRLWCVRDAIGHRTLCYRLLPGCFAVASSPRAVARLDGGPIELDLDKVAQFLVLAEDRDRTFYRDVLRLPPGHVLSLGAPGLRLRRYWGMQQIAPVRLRSDAAYMEAFRSLWRDAVACRLPEAGPAGIMLSAGLDSSSVATTAAAVLRERGELLYAFHAAPRQGFDGAVRKGWIADEAEDVRAIAAMHENLELEVLRPATRTFLDDADAFFAHTCMPPVNTDNRHWFEEILVHASSRGLPVMLGGFKGNATISYTGVRALRTWAYTGRWHLLYTEARALAAARGRRTRAILREAVLAGLPAPVHALVRGPQTAASIPLVEVLPTAIRPGFAAERQVDKWVAASGLDPRRPDRTTGREYRARIIGRIGDAADLYRGLRALYGIPLLDPTTDVRVVEFCLGIPEQQYLRGGRERQLVRRAMAGHLPERVLQRPTRGSQGADWHERLGALRGRMAEALADIGTSDAARECLDLPRLRRLLDEWPAAGTIEAQPDYRFRLTSGIMMGRFIRWFETDRTLRP